MDTRETQVENDHLWGDRKETAVDGEIMRESEVMRRRQQSKNKDWETVEDKDGYESGPQEIDGN